MEDKRDLTADLKTLTIIPRDPEAPVDNVHDVVAPHALRWAIAAEAALAEVQQKLNLLEKVAAKEMDRLERKLAETQQTISRMQAKIIVLERDNEMLESTIEGMKGETQP